MVQESQQTLDFNINGSIGDGFQAKNLVIFDSGTGDALQRRTISKKGYEIVLTNLFLIIVPSGRKYPFSILKMNLKEFAKFDSTVISLIVEKIEAVLFIHEIELIEFTQGFSLAISFERLTHPAPIHLEQSVVHDVSEETETV